MTISGIDRRHRHEPLFDVHPVTGASIEVFYADTALTTFGGGGAGWFWWSRRRGLTPDGLGPSLQATRRIGTRYWLKALGRAAG